MSKKVAVLFSGGLDSTYLVWKNLIDGNDVQPIYVEIENNKTKTILEKNRIKLLINEFRKDKDFEDKIHDIKYMLKVNVDAVEDSLYFKQVPLWILAAIFSQDLNIDEIQIAYVANDDAIGYLADIQNVYKSYEPLMRYLKPLVFPLSKKPKYEMAHQLPEMYRKFIFSCENARIIGSEDAEIIDYEPCCGCAPCKHIIESDYYGIGKFPERYKNGIIRSHALALWGNGFRVLDKNENDYEYIKKIECKKEPYQLELYFDGGYIDKVEEDSSNLEKVPFNG